jgi:hypothetical protein
LYSKIKTINTLQSYDIFQKTMIFFVFFIKMIKISVLYCGFVKDKAIATKHKNGLPLAKEGKPFFIGE